MATRKSGDEMEAATPARAPWRDPAGAAGRRAERRARRARCARCAQARRGKEGGGVWCEGCFEEVRRERADAWRRGGVGLPGQAAQHRGTGARAARRPTAGRLERSFLVEMVAKRYKGYAVRELSKRERDRMVKTPKGQVLKCRLQELERIFGPGKERAGLLPPGPRRAASKARKKPPGPRRFGPEAGFAACEVQRVWRGARERARLARRDAAAAKMQAAARGRLVRESPELALLRAEREAARGIQRAVRSRQARAESERRRVRRVLEERLIRERREAERRRSAVSLQRISRGHKARRALKAHKESAVRMQAAIRGRLSRVAFQHEKARLARRAAAASAIQRCARAQQCRKRINRRIWLRQADRACGLLQRVWRAHGARKSIQQARTSVSTFQDLWALIASAYGDGTGNDDEGVAALVEERFAHVLQPEEAKLHVGLWLLSVGLEYERAIDMLQRAAVGQAGDAEDPRTLYALALARRMAGGGVRGFDAASLANCVLRAKRLDVRSAIAERKRPLFLFAPSTMADYRPCVAEIDFVLRRAMLVRRPADADTGRALALRQCLYGVFKQRVEKDRGGAEYFLRSALAQSPSDPFILSCFYGGKASGPNLPVEVSVEDFDEVLRDRHAEPVHALRSVTQREFCVNIDVFSRTAPSKWTRASSAVDLLIRVSRAGPRPETEPKLLVVSNGHLRQLAAFIDQPELLHRAQRPKMLKYVARNIELVRASRRDAGQSGSESFGGRDDWAVWQAALRFEQSPIAEKHIVTPAGFGLSVQFYLENCERLRVVAFCDKLKQTFVALVERAAIVSLCRDSPRMRRVFQRHGWRHAANHCRLVSRVARLLELTQFTAAQLAALERDDPFAPVSPGSPVNVQATEPLLLEGRIIQRHMRTPGRTTSATRHELVLTGLDEAVQEISERWAASRIQGLFRGSRGRAAARERRRALGATKLQSLSRGWATRRRFAVLYTEHQRHKLASKIAAVIRSALVRKSWRSGPLRDMLDVPPDGECTWAAAWPVLHRLRRLQARSLVHQRLWELSFGLPAALSGHRAAPMPEEPTVFSPASHAGPLQAYAVALESLLLGPLHRAAESETLLVRATACDPGRKLIRPYCRLLFERAARVHNESPAALATWAVVSAVLLEAPAAALSALLDRAAALDGAPAGQVEFAARMRQLLESRAARREAFAVVIQRFWRMVRSQPRMLFELAVEGACAKLSHECHRDHRTAQTDPAEMESFVFIKHALEVDLSGAEAAYEEYVTQCPEHATFRFGRAVLRFQLGRAEAGRQDLAAGQALDASGAVFEHAHQRYFETAVHAHRDNPGKHSQALLAIAVINLLIRKDPARAHDHLVLAMERDPTNLGAVELHADHFSVAGPTGVGASALLEQDLERQRQVQLRLERSASRLEATLLRRSTSRATIARMSSRRQTLSALRVESAAEAEQRAAREREQEAAERTSMAAEDFLAIAREARRTRALREGVLTQRELAELRKANREAARRKKRRKTTKQ